MGFIYLITNLINQKQYVGYTGLETVQKRFNTHWNTRYSDESYLHNAMIKYGRENFSIQQIDLTTDEDWEEKEQYWIQYYHTLAPCGYNICIGGQKPPVYYGNNNPMTKIDDEDVRDIYEDLLEYKLSIKEIADKYHVSSDQIERINAGKNRKLDGYDFPLRKMKKQCWDVYHIIEDMKNGLSQTELEIKYQIKSRTKLYDISHGKIGKKQILKIIIQFVKILLIVFHYI